MSEEDTVFPIVGVGASAGGIHALEQFFGAVEEDVGAAFVIVTHLSPDRESALHQIIARYTKLRVEIASDDLEVARNHVYVLPANAIMTIETGRLVVRAAHHRSERNPIDIFFSALATDQGECAIGVILSGSGSDGTLGIKAIKEHGGVTFAQVANRTKPLFADMPSSAMATGLVDFMIPVDDMGPKILDYVRGLQRGDELAASRPHADGTDPFKDRRLTIYSILRNQIGHDFSGYKVTTFLRRVQRRMRVLQIQDLDLYIDRLRQDSEEVVHLFRDLLINVTNFFRDADAFEALKSIVIPKLFENRGADDTVRIWVPGCATGEEVFSIAILMREHMRTLRAVPRVQIFATDIDAPALAVARSARYPEGLLDSVSSERRERFFIEDGSAFVVAKEIRDMCIFSPHSVIRDPPFSRIDMVSCRNLLIYFGHEIQSQVIPTFHYSLRSGGYLFLGTSENISRYAELFTTVDKKQRIFQARDHDRRSVGILPFSRMPAFIGSRGATFLMDNKGHGPLTYGGSGIGPPMRQRVQTHVLEHYTLPHVVVTHEGDVVYYSTRTGKYLEAAPGLPSRQLLTMARRGLRLDLRAAMREAIETRKTTSRDGLTVEGEEGRIQMVSIVVEPLLDRNDDDPLLLILFQDQGPALDRQDAASRGASRDADGAVMQLEQDLRDTRERLQSMIEEYETALEELKSSNEELVSVNEELQSTNEELEASKEEMQSLNEELQTVNLELSGKLDDLDRVNADLHNLFQSTQIATVFLDRDLVIRSFTPTVSHFFAILASDRGRPLTDLASRLDYPSLHQDVRNVLRSGVAREQQIERHEEGEAGAHYLVRLVPYRETDGTVAGVVLTFVDVSRLVRSEGRQIALIDKLDQRVGAMIMLMRGIAERTRQDTETPAAFSEAFSDRLMVLARSNDLLSRYHWSDVPLTEVIGQELALQGLDRVSMEGPSVALAPKTSLCLGLVLHELAVNASNGALALDRDIHIGWSVTAAPSETGKTMLTLTWTETGGEAVTSAPPGAGLGPDRIEHEMREMLGGICDIALRAEGPRVSIRVPLN